MRDEERARIPSGLGNHRKITRLADVGTRIKRHWFSIFPQHDTSIGRTQSSRLIKQHANSANSYILKRARR